MAQKAYIYIIFINIILVNSIMINKKYNFVIFHKNCMDGFTGFFVLYLSNRIDKNAIIVPDVPSAKYAPNGIDGKDVIIIDVAYKYDVLKEIVHRSKSVVFIDHHVTIRDDVIKIKKDKDVEIVYDEFKSGASLAWHYLFPRKKVPLFIKYIEDNDIGAWKLKHTHPFISALSVKYQLKVDKHNLKKWHNLLDINEIKKLIKKGEIYGEYISKLVNDSIKRYSLESFPSEKIYSAHSDFFEKPGQYEVAVYCGTGCPSSSLVGLHMAQKIKCDFVILWTLNLDKKEYVLSLRSNSTDVGVIAQIFGGGGHKLAAACSFSSKKYNIEDLFFPNSLPRR